MSWQRSVLNFSFVSSVSEFALQSMTNTHQQLDDEFLHSLLTTRSTTLYVEKGNLVQYKWTCLGFYPWDSATINWVWRFNGSDNVCHTGHKIHNQGHFVRFGARMEKSLMILNHTRWKFYGRLFCTPTWLSWVVSSLQTLSRIAKEWQTCHWRILLAATTLPSPCWFMFEINMSHTKLETESIFISEMLCLWSQTAQMQLLICF